MENILIEFDKILREKNLTNYNKLLPPLSSIELSEKLLQIRVNDQSFKKLYEWKNGHDIMNGIRCQIFHFDTLISMNNLIRQVEINKLDKYNIWKDSFIPIITDSTGQWLLFNNKKGKNFKKIYLYSASLLFVTPISYFDSVDSMIQTSIIAYENKVFEYNIDEDWLDIDVKKFREVAEKININSDYWKLR